jgi:MFS family permease
MAEDPERSYRGLLRVPSLGRVLVGMTLARIAGTMVYLALVLFALQRYGSPEVAGAVAFAMMFPGLVASPIAGALLDRYGRIRLVLLDYVVAGSLMGLIGVLALADALPAWLLILIVGAASLTEPLSSSGLRSLFPLIVPEPLWERANAADSNSMVIATLVGPPVATVLVQLWGGPAAVLVLATVYGLAVLAMVGVPEPIEATPASGGLLADARAGVAYVCHDSTLRSLAMSISLSNLAFGALEIALPVMVLTRFQASAAVVGAAWAAMAAAGLVSASLAGRIDTRGIERPLLVWPLLGIGLATAILLADAGVWVVFVAAILIGLLLGPIDVAMMTVRQRVTDPAWMGRAFAVSMALNALGGPFGALAGGWLVSRSVDAAIAFSVGASLMAGVVAALTMERRRIPAAVPQA